MDEKAASGIMLTLLLAGMLTLTFNAQPVKASGTIYIRADGSIDPPTASIQQDGDIYTFTDNIYDSIVVQRKNIVIDGAGYTVQGGGTGIGIDLTSTANVTVDNTEVSTFTDGIKLDSSNDNTLCSNTVTDSWHGILLRFSSFNTLYNNTVIDNNIGIDLYYCSNNLLHENKAINNGYGIYIQNCEYNTLDGNTATENYGYYGIYIHGSNDNVLFGNNVTNNKYYGIGLMYSSINSVSGNTATHNRNGIRLLYSYTNYIHHNSFINNVDHVNTRYSGNIWDAGYPYGGNYWSDYTIRYPGAQELDDSGIWDTPYVIDGNNQDNYPLMEPWTPTPPTIMASLDIDPDTLNLRSKGKWITAYLQLPEDCDPEDIDATTVLLNGTVSPVVDPKYDFVTNSSEYLVDHNNDGILERMVKFDRAEVESFILDHINLREAVKAGFTTITLTVTVELSNGTPFQGSDTIKIICTAPQKL